MFNWLKTTILMAAIIALFIVIGGLVGGNRGIIFALLSALGTNLISYWCSDKLVLRMYNAYEVDEINCPEFYGMIRTLSENAGLPMPRVYLIHEDAPNAFATGRNQRHAAVAATTGIVDILSERELCAVMSHELAHIKHYDILISTISATIAGFIAALAHFFMLFGNRDEDGKQTNPISSIAVAFLAPFAASLIQMAISRSREFEADRTGAEICKDPVGLALALKKIHAHASRVPFRTVESHPETAQMMIINPLCESSIGRLFSTHPETGERIFRLLEMERTGRYPIA